MKTPEEVEALWDKANPYNTEKRVFELVQALRDAITAKDLALDELKLFKDMVHKTQNAAVVLDEKFKMAREALMRVQHDMRDDGILAEETKDLVNAVVEKVHE